ncbi:transaldolase [Svornostia abyssi]|uniref:Transaldolase n=1 Tax=Svornostia abyssi TaxID=2898438 RepID=A0ABY5PD04_9ACTN|nr:transaldolase [Parviterribacteraceae bacterium J379]
MSDNRLRAIGALGQAVWIDNLNRALLRDGGLRPLLDEDGVTGVTSNPAIFQKAMGGSDRYDDDYREALAETSDPREIFFHLGFSDIRAACDQLRGVYDATNAQDGYVSFELPPELADDADGSIAAAVDIHARIDRPNVLIKVPGTAAGVVAFEELTARGISVNVTLLFAVSRYEEIARAYISGLQRRVDAGQAIDKIASVASFFVSRVDTKVDAALDAAGRADLKGKAAVANAQLAYQSFLEIFSGPDWEALAARGAMVQRPLWASTGVKNPDYPDTLYVDTLIGPDTVNTMPDATLAAARDHATPARTVDADFAGAAQVIADVRAAGVDLEHIVLTELVDEGVQLFVDAFEALIASIGERARELAPAG